MAACSRDESQAGLPPARFSHAERFVNDLLVLTCSDALSATATGRLAKPGPVDARNQRIFRKLRRAARLGALLFAKVVNFGASGEARMNSWSVRVEARHGVNRRISHRGTTIEEAPRHA